MIFCEVLNFDLTFIKKIVIRFWSYIVIKIVLDLIININIHKTGILEFSLL